MNRIKTELFFLYRLLQEGYGPRYWRPYIKNRFFGERIISRLPRHEYVADPGLELHTICSKRDLVMFVWMLRSFLFFSKLKPAVVIHDDGTLDEDSAGLLNDIFGENVKIWFLGKTRERVLSMDELPDIIKKARQGGHFFLNRLIDIFVLSSAKKLIVMDTDILFYKTPKEVMNFIEGRSEYDALTQRQVKDEIVFDLAMDNYFIEKYKTKEKRAALMNGGFLLFNGEKLKLEQLIEYLAHTKRPFSDYFIEMAGWACILAQLNFKFLDPKIYAIKGFLNDDMVMKHYTSPRRYEMFAYGIDEARKKIKEQNDQRS